MDTSETLILAIIPPLFAIFVEAVNPIRYRFLESSVERDFEEFRGVFSAATRAAAAPPAAATPAPTTPVAPMPDFDDLIETASGSTRAAVELSMLALTVVSVITSGFVIIREIKEPYWSPIFYSIFFMGVAFLLWRLLAGHTLFQIDENEAWTLRLRGRRGRSFSRSHVIAFTIYVMNGLLIIFAFWILKIPESWIEFLKQHRPAFFAGLAGLASIALVISYMSSPQTRQRRTAILITILAVVAMVMAELITDPRLANMVASVSGSGLGSAPDSDRESTSLTDANVQGIQRRLDDAGAALSVIQKTLAAMQVRLGGAEATMSVIKKTVEGADEQLLDMRIAQPVNLSYLTGADCRRVQQALQELAGYKGGADGKCDGTTNAAARAWQIQERRTIAPAWSAEEIERTLRTPPDKWVSTDR